MEAILKEIKNRRFIARLYSMGYQTYRCDVIWLHPCVKTEVSSFGALTHKEAANRFISILAAKNRRRV